MKLKRVSLACVFVLAFAPLVLAQDQKNTTVVDLAWLAGTWEGEMWGGATKEHWAQTSSDSLMCMFSFVKEGKPVFYEFLTLERRDQRLVLHMRHFHAKLIAWEDKESPLLFAITKATPNEVIFDRIDSAAVKVKIGYKLDAPDRLTAFLEKVQDGKESKEVFHFRRASPK